MDNIVLKKRLSSFRTGKDFCQGLEMTSPQLGVVIKKGRKLSKKGHYGSGEFKEIKLDGLVGAPSTMPIEVGWDKGKVIRFSQVDDLR